MSDSQTPPTLPTIAWLARHRGPQLRQALVEREGVAMPASLVLSMFAAADPDLGKRATQWLVDTYLAGGYRWEDIRAGATSKACATLLLFAQHRADLPAGQRRLVDHTSLASLYAALAPLVEDTRPATDATPTGRELRRLERAHAREQSIILHESPELRVVVPTTELAAQWWGRGTQWCTAADNDNAFDHYNRMSPLIIAVLPTTRFQLWLNGGGFQFMDEHDMEVSPQQVEQHWTALRPLMEWACTRSSKIMGLLPDQAFSPEFCAGLIEADPMALELMPNKRIPTSLYAMAVAHDAKAFGFVPDDYKDPQMCWDAVGRLGTNIRYVLPGTLTPELCLRAFEQDSQCVFDMPRAYRLPEYVRSAIADNGSLLSKVDMAERTPELCALALQNYPQAFWFIPGEHKPMFYERIVHQDGLMLRLIPDSARTLALCMVAVSNSQDAMQHVPERLRTAELCSRALATSGLCLQYVPAHLKNPQMCSAAVGLDPEAIEFVPKEWRTHEICLAAVTGTSRQTDMLPYTDFGLLHHVPDALQTDELRMLAVQANGGNLTWVSEYKQTPQMCLASVISRPDMLRFVTPRLRSALICGVAMQAEPDFCREYLPPELGADYPVEPVQNKVAWIPQTHLDGLAESLGGYRGQVDDLPPVSSSPPGSP